MLRVLFIATVLIFAALVVGLIIARRNLKRAAEAQRVMRAADAERLLVGRRRAETGYVLEKIEQQRGELALDNPEDRALHERLHDLEETLTRTETAGPVPVPVSGPCAEVIDAYRDAAGERELVYSESGDGRWLHVLAERDLLRWVVDETFRNAMAHAGAWSRIDVKAEPVQDGVLLTIADDGVGLDRPAAARLYGMFTPRTGSGGPGLGLFVARRIVESFGGTIEARTAPGGGLQHAIRLPCPPGGVYDAGGPRS